jgi:hypothetical protein
MFAVFLAFVADLCRFLLPFIAVFRSFFLFYQGFLSWYQSCISWVIEQVNCQKTKQAHKGPYKELNDEHR